MLCYTDAILWTINLHWSYLFLMSWAVWYWHKWSNKWVVLPLHVATDVTRSNKRYHPFCSQIIPDKWRCFSFWHQVFFFCDFLLLLLIFQCSYQRLTPCAGPWSASAHWIRTNVIGESLCVRYPCHYLLHCRPCHVTIVHTYIAMTMLKFQDNDMSCSSKTKEI